MQLQFLKFSELFSYAATVFPRNYFCISILWKGIKNIDFLSYPHFFIVLPRAHGADWISAH